MISISSYTDYRAFLKDYYEEAKARNPGYSYQVLSRMAGIKSKGFLHNVISGKRSLSVSNVFGIARALKLDKHETEYLENLVALDSAACLEEKNLYYDRLSSIKANGKTAWQPQILRNEQFEFYSKLHHSVIRSLIDLLGFKGDYARLAASVNPRITPRQAKRSVELMRKLGLICKDTTGRYAITEKSIATPREVVTLATLNFHKESAELALRALTTMPREQRNFSCVTLGISRKAYERICEEIREFRAKLVQIAEADVAADTVYQVNFQCFPVSNLNPTARVNPGAGSGGSKRL
jgi:uncharacterized protein (TIGR02147 family)